MCLGCGADGSAGSRGQGHFGAPHFVFNNAGVGAAGLALGSTRAADWEWVLGVNLWGVIHGVRLFTPMMLEAAKARPRAMQGHIVDTRQHGRSAGAAEHGRVQRQQARSGVSLTETLYQDLAPVSDQVSASLLCPYLRAHRHQPQRAQPPQGHGQRSN